MPPPDLDRLQALAAATGRMLPEPVRVRPPAEERAVLIRATRGCAWNTCRYCNLYRDGAAGLRPLAEVREDLALAAALHGTDTTTLFFGDADLLAMRASDAIALVRAAHETFPALHRMSAYVIPGSAVQWTPDALARLSAAGLHRLYANVDTNGPRLHALVQRPGTPAEQREGLHRLTAAGFGVWVGVLLGLGGADYSREHIAKTAACVNAAAPEVVSIRTLACGDAQPLTAPIREARLELAWAGAEPSPLQSPLGTLQELRALIHGLTCATEIVCDHASNFLPHLRGHLPAHREALLEAIATAEAQLRAQKRPVPIRIFM